MIVNDPSILYYYSLITPENDEEREVVFTDPAYDIYRHRKLISRLSSLIV